MRFLLAIRCFFSVWFLGRLPKGAEGRLSLPSTATTPSPSPSTATATAMEAGTGDRSAVQLLSLLQREGRLLDFLTEEIDGYSDAQIGAAVRDIHRGCRRVLAEHCPVEPVLKEAENAQVRVDAGFDPSRIRLIGKVIGDPPFTGTLKHHGWRIGKISLPEGARAPQAAQAFDPSVVAPAEVELS
jgi:hypothetical protein